MPNGWCVWRCIKRPHPGQSLAALKARWLPRLCEPHVLPPLLPLPQAELEDSRANVPPAAAQLVKARPVIGLTMGDRLALARNLFARVPDFVPGLRAGHISDVGCEALLNQFAPARCQVVLAEWEIMGQ
jgi:hypothetical protein